MHEANLGKEIAMTLTLSEPVIIERGPYQVVGAYGTYMGDDEGPGWAQAFGELSRRQSEISNRVDDVVLGFLYRPHKDDPTIPAEVKACFVGVEVADLDHVPAGMVVTRFSGGQYVIVDCQGDVQDEATEGVGAAINYLFKWIPEHGYHEGDACLAVSHEKAVRPPFIEQVYIKIEREP
jgi:predicted transcriptional regulator YdeE